MNERVVFFIAILNEKEREREREKKVKYSESHLCHNEKLVETDGTFFKGVEKSLKHLLNGVHRGFRVYRVVTIEEARI